MCLEQIRNSNHSLKCPTSETSCRRCWLFGMKRKMAWNRPIYWLANWLYSRKDLMKTTPWNLRGPQMVVFSTTDFFFFFFCNGCWVYWISETLLLDRSNLTSLTRFRNTSMFNGTVKPSVHLLIRYKITTKTGKIGQDFGASFNLVTSNSCQAHMSTLPFFAANYKPIHSEVLPSVYSVFTLRDFVMGTYVHGNITWKITNCSIKNVLNCIIHVQKQNLP